MTNDEVHELAAGYALDALDADDRQAFESHLAECERCRAELAGLSETVGTLAFAVEACAPGGAARPDPDCGPRGGAERRGATAAPDPALRGRRGCRGRVRGTRDRPLGGALGRRVAGVAAGAVDQGGAARRLRARPVAPAGRPTRSGSSRRGAAARRSVRGRRRRSCRLTRPVPEGATVAITLERAGGDEPIVRPSRTSAPRDYARLHRRAVHAARPGRPGRRLPAS